MVLTNRSNPQYILRTYLARLAIDKAETGDYGSLHALQSVLENSYDSQIGKEHVAARRPEWAPYRTDGSMLSSGS